MAEFVLHIKEIEEGGKDYAFPVRTAWLAETLAGTGVSVDGDVPDGKLDFYCHRSGADIILHGRVSANLVVPCARCLEAAKVGVDTSISSLLTARGEAHRPPADEVELTPEELDREFYTGDQIVLDDIVREHLLLELPLKPLCAEDCPGIPVPSSSSRFEDAAEAAVDPRLAPLLALVGSIDKKE